MDYFWEKRHPFGFTYVNFQVFSTFFIEKNTSYKITLKRYYFHFVLRRYIYAEDTSDWDVPLAMATLFCAKKYKVRKLARACRHFIQHHMSPKNACLVLAQVWLFNQLLFLSNFSKTNFWPYFGHFFDIFLAIFWPFFERFDSGKNHVIYGSGTTE